VVEGATAGRTPCLWVTPPTDVRLSRRNYESTGDEQLTGHTPASRESSPVFCWNTMSTEALRRLWFCASTSESVNGVTLSALSAQSGW